MALFRIMGWAPTKADTTLKNLVGSSYRSVEVVGRGTIKIDPEEVRETDEFKEASERAKAIVNA
ncbi:hypothetical protein [Asticcacaulis benevestitus]|uniref:hypothetical protein n=1 Tax=Asticcacaulis benevestitus TaxID=347481 RepID=UPI0009DA7730|nr:hypothetical protein [Asticcacaulis benevestitus]